MKIGRVFEELFEGWGQFVAVSKQTCNQSILITMENDYVILVLKLKRSLQEIKCLDLVHENLNLTYWISLS